MKVSQTAQTDVLESTTDETQDPEVSAVAKESMGKSVSIQDAVDRLVLSYSIAKEWDASQFAEDYVRRPVATMEDVFGSADLEYESDTDYITKKKYKKVRVNHRIDQNLGEVVVGMGTIGDVVGKAITSVFNTSMSYHYRTVVEKVYHYYLYWKKSKGKEGFFSRALADVDDVFILVEPTVRRILELKHGSDVLKKLDTRKEKRDAVLVYMEQIAKNLTTGEA